MDNRADELYGAWPERLYILDARGIIVYKGELGPFGFKPEEVAASLSNVQPPAKPDTLRP